MKNINIILIILLCVVVIAAVLLVARMTAQPNLEKVLPISTVIYCYIPDFPLAKSDLKETAIYKATQNLKIAELGKNKVNDYYRKVEGYIDFDIRKLEPYFKKDVAWAILEWDKKRSDILFVILANIKDSKKELKKYFEEELKPQLQNQGYKIASKNYKGYDYFIVAGKKPLFYYAFLGKIFLYSKEEGAMLRVINLSQGQGMTLKENKNFQRVKSKLSYKKGLLFYTDISAILTTYKEKLKGKKEGFGTLYRLMGIDSLRGFGLNSSVEREGFRTRAFVQLPKDASGIMQIVLKHKPRKVECLNYIPREFPLVNIGAFYNPSQIWDDTLEQLSKLLPPAQYQSFQNRISLGQQALDIDLKKDVLDCLGNEMAICAALTQPESEKQIKHPLEILEKGSFLLLMEVNKVKRLSALLERLIAAGGLYLKAKPQEEEYKDYKLKYLKGERFSPATPGFTFIENFLLVSSHIEPIKRAIDAYQAGKVLNSHADFLKAYEGMEEKINRLVYMDVRAILKQAPLLCLNLLAPEGKSPQEMEQLKKELIQLSDKIFGSCMVAKVTRDGIIMDSYCSLGPVPLLAGRPALLTLQKRIPVLTKKRIP